MQQGNRYQAEPAQTTEAPPAGSLRYLRFVRALVLGSALAAAPMVMSGCGNSQCAASSCPDAVPVPDAPPPDAPPLMVVDGPLPPPDLPLA